MTDRRCGTYAGYNAHVHAGTKPCRDCQGAQTAYVRAWRAAHPEHAAHQNEVAKARSRALTRLTRLHPADFLRLVTEEREKAGVPW